MNFIMEREESKKKIILSAVVCFLTVPFGVTMFIISSAFKLETWMRTLLTLTGITVVFGGIGVAVALDITAGTYECPNCHTRFVPTLAAYIAGPHTLTKRKLKCPNCGESSYCKKRLTH